MSAFGSKPRLIGAGVIGLSLFVGWLISGERTPNTFQNGQMCTVNWPVGQKPAAADIVCVQARADVTAFGTAFVGCDAGAGQASNMLFRICGSEWDGGAIPSVFDKIGNHVEVIEHSIKEVVYDGGPAFVGLVKAAADLEWPCACSPGPGTCERRNNAGAWVSAATYNNVMLEGRWRGACVRTPCDESGGRPSYPASCVP